MLVALTNASIGVEVLGRHQRARPDQGGQQALAADRLEQVVERIDFERIDGEFVERRHEDHQRHRLRVVAVAFAGASGDVARELDAGHPRHLHVHQDDLRPLRFDLRQRLGGIGGLADDPMGELRRQIGQHLA